jgi:hypothetical protein
LRQLWACSIDTLRRLIQAMQSLWRRRSTFRIIAWLGGRMKIWQRSETYLQDFYARAGDEWHRSAWDFRNPISSSSDKVHLDVQFSRYRADGSLLDRSQCVVRMRGDKVDDLGKMRGHWVVLTRPTGWPFVA